MATLNIKHLPDRLSSVLVRRRPFGGQERRGRVAEFFGQLRRQRGGLSFRELFERYSDLVLALTPCLLVSPASAANFLAPGATRFDLVVFDEASQIRVAEAIGAMGRGSAAVIVGDSRQMPPTTIMQASHEVNEDPADTPVPEDMDSILSEAVESGVPQCWLSWHYRSQDETLIAFSNRYYYDNKLSSLPSPGHDGTAGIHWRRVDGRFDRAGTRTNEVEAREIVDDILRRLRDPRTRDDSIGVVTFNIQQRDLILNLLEESGDPMITERLSADLAEPIFVKNLENVQGDERDVILFSLAFSTDPVTGRLPLNFGPLSQAGGERRLNVAITRARRQVVLFASFDPNDIDLSRTNARGTQHLRAYCELAAAGVDRLADLSRGGPDRLGRIWAEVAEAIRQRGYEVAIGYGLSDFSVDIAVREPGSPYWQAAVILDGPHWRDRPTVADRDGAPALLHRLMKWPVVLRFWLPEWIRDRDRFLDRLDEAVKRTSRVLENDSEPAVAQPAPVRSIPPEPGTTAAPVQAASTLPQGSTAPASTHIGMATSTLRPQRPAQAQQGLTSATGEIKVIKFQPYVPDRIGDQSDLDLFPSSSSVRSRVRDALFEVLTAEGPIEQNRLARLTLQRFGFQKAHEERRTRVLSLLRRELIRRDRQAGSFVWPPGVHPDTWRVVRTATEPNMRTIEEVPPEEIANAACAALARAPFMEADLLRSIMEFLGFRRKTDNVERRLRLGLRLAIDGDRIVQGSDGRYRRTE